MTPATLLLLAGCNLIVGSGAMVVTGLLARIGHDLEVGPAAAAQLITAYAIAFAISAPLVAVLAARVCRKQLLVVALGAFGVLMIASAWAPRYELLWALRALTGAAAAAFVPNASAVVGALSAPAARGRALAIVFSGFTAALVLGAPLGTHLGIAFGWRPTIAGLGGLAVAAAVVAKRRLPGGIMLAGATLANLRATVQQPRLIGLIGVTMISAFGSFVVFSFAAIALPVLLRQPATVIASALLVFGLGSMLGNVASVIAIDRLGAPRIVTVGLLVTALALGALASEASVALAWAAIVVWGLGSFVVATAQQSRLVDAAPRLSAALLPLSSSAQFAGTSLGAGFGGVWLAHDAQAVAGLAWIACAALAGAALLSFVLATRLRNPAGAP
jgi:predicted MFS family arabinose efflux permease